MDTEQPQKMAQKLEGHSPKPRMPGAIRSPGGGREDPPLEPLEEHGPGHTLILEDFCPETIQFCCFKSPFVAIHYGSPGPLTHGTVSWFQKTGRARGQSWGSSGLWVGREAPGKPALGQEQQPGVCCTQGWLPVGEEASPRLKDGDQDSKRERRAADRRNCVCTGLGRESRMFPRITSSVYLEHMQQGPSMAGGSWWSWSQETSSSCRGVRTVIIFQMLRDSS